MKGIYQMKYLLTFAVIVFISGCTQGPSVNNSNTTPKQVEVSDNSESSIKSSPDAKSSPGKIEYSGGDGSSMAKAVIIAGAADTFAGIQAENDWIKINHPGWRKKRQSLMHSDGKAYDYNEYTTHTRETKTIYFDITDFFGNY